MATRGDGREWPRRPGRVWQGHQGRAGLGPGADSRTAAAARLGAARELEAESGRRVTPPAACAHAWDHMMLGCAGYCDHQANHEPASGCGH